MNEIKSPDEQAWLDEIQREERVHDVNNEITLYQNTGDARFLWRAFLLLREYKMEIPEDFLAKLESWGRKLLTAETPEQIAARLELVGDRKRPIGVKYSEAYRRRWRLASEVQMVMRLYKKSQAEAIRMVARNRGLTESNVKKQYQTTFVKPTGKARRKTTPEIDLAAAMGWGKLPG